MQVNALKARLTEPDYFVHYYFNWHYKGFYYRLTVKIGDNYKAQVGHHLEVIVILTALKHVSHAKWTIYSPNTSLNCISKNGSEVKNMWSNFVDTRPDLSLLSAFFQNSAVNGHPGAGDACECGVRSPGCGRRVQLLHTINRVTRRMWVLRTITRVRATRTGAAYDQPVHHLFIRKVVQL